MKAPRFWYRPPGVASALLTPAAALWTAIATHRQVRTAPYRCGVPVLCVGNLVAGGAGKTPVVRELVRRMAARGLTAASLSRGHGGRLPGPLPVDPLHHTAADVGDEPLLLSRHGSAWIGRDRAEAAKAMTLAGIGAIILDDGFQNPGLHKDLSLIVVDGGSGFGNGCVIPAGPLREPVAAGLARAQALVLMGDGAGAADAHAAAHSAGIPVLTAKLRPDPVAAQTLRSRRVLAFAGIGRPTKFFDTLRQIGAEPLETLSFADHHPYSRGEITALLARAQARGLLPVTTEKDAMRLPVDLREAITILPVTVAFDEPAALDRLLDGLGGVRMNGQS